MRRSERSDRGRASGQASLLVVMVLGVVVVVLLVVGAVGAVAADRARARTAADAAALAAAVEGEGAARDVARRNGGVVVRLDRHGDAVEVTVRVGRAEATSRARAVRDVGSVPGPPRTRWSP